MKSLPVWTLAIALGILPPPASMAQVPAADFPVTSGTVRMMALAGDTLFLGGDFSWIGYSNGSMVALDAASGLPIAPWPRVVTGQGVGPFAFTSIRSATTTLPDGEGGCYVGGSFAAISGVPRSGLAHIRADGSLDGWNPAVEGIVEHMVRIGGTLYVAGNFTALGGLPRHGIGALDMHTGAVLPWAPTGSDPDGQAEWHALATDGKLIYVAGRFDQVSGQPRNGLAAIDGLTALATKWNPSPDGEVNALAIADDVVFVGGSFQHIGGATRRGVAAIEPWGGTALEWNANLDGSVQRLCLSGGSLYLTGWFANAGGAARDQLAAVGTGTALATPWNPQLDIASNSTLAADGDVVYLGGLFLHAGGQPRVHLAAVDTLTGAVLPWNPGADQPVSHLSCSPSRVFASGYFAGCGGRDAHGLGAIDMRTRRVLPWNPQLDGFPSQLVVTGSTLVAGGWFTSVNGFHRGGLAAFERGTGELMPWNPAGAFDNAVRVLATDGSKLFMEGDLPAFRSPSRHALAALDLASGLPTAWQPSYHFAANPMYEHISAIVPVGDRVFLTGEFDLVGGLARLGMAAVDSSSGVALDWDAHVTGRVEAVSRLDTTLYVSGAFWSVAGQPRNGIAAVRTTSGALTPWPSWPFASAATILCEDSTVVLGMLDDELIADMKNALVALDATSGAPRDWYPNIYKNLGYEYGPPILSLVRHASGLVVGGTPQLLAGPLFRPSLVLLRPVNASAPLVSLLAPGAGDALITGSHALIHWQASDDQAVLSADIHYSSTSSTGPWELVAAGVTGANCYDWTVPPPGSTGLGWIRVDARDEDGSTGFAVLAAPLTIAFTTGVQPGRPSAPFSIEPLSPHPVRGPATLAYTLSVAAPVRLSVVDVQGREVALLDSRDREPGRHTALLRSAQLQPGLYFVRLQSGGRPVASRRLFILR
ncbi:MAG: hypothetical protein IT348_02525 [Candidatus Eisenbacteria bacterium]|nr:hypothetical protein [Candidatus Eisenbacteria bacterium]